VDHLVADRDGVGRLNDLVGIAVNRRHHRARKPTGDATVVHAAIVGGIRTSFAVAGIVEQGHGGLPALRLRRHRREPAVGRIADEPGPAAFGAQMIVPVRWPGACFGAADTAGDLLGDRGALRSQPGEVRLGERARVFSRKLLRPLKGVFASSLFV
jgi:hypothetical protein